MSHRSAFRNVRGTGRHYGRDDRMEGQTARTEGHTLSLCFGAFRGHRSVFLEALRATVAIVVFSAKENTAKLDRRLGAQLHGGDSAKIERRLCQQAVSRRG